MSLDRLDPGLDASRPRSGIITPSSEGSVRPASRHHDELVADSKKRKFAEYGVEDSANESLGDLFKTSVVVKPHPPNLAVKPRVLQPLMLLPREHLSLSYLDLSAPTGDLPCPGNNRLIESHIRILDLERRLDTAATTVLIARSESSGAVYAIERHDGDLYAACKLGSWVDLDVLRQRATAFSKRLLPKDVEAAEAGQQNGKPATTPAMQRAQKKKKVAIEAFQSMVRKNARSQSVSTIGDVLGSTVPSSDTQTPDNEGTDDQKHSGLQTRPAAPPIQIEELAPPDASTILENVRSQYFEALYKSKGSLAYFAKGPLSRARATFHLDFEADLDMRDLINFLTGLILTTDQINKKYQKTMPEMISQIKTYVDSSDEAKSRKRRNRKMKLGQNALYPVEEDFIRTWWSANKPPTKDEDTNTAISLPQIRSHLKLLWARETELQMILIMEILSLEKICPVENENGGQPPGVLPTTEKTSAPPKKRGKQNKLPDLLDLHADRLCIWQSTASEQLILDNGLVDAPEQDPEGEANQTSSSEPLRDFCVDIILPFFSARLPDICKSINRKLGGPKIVSEKSKPSRTPNPAKNDPKPKPGTATKRPVQPKPAKSTRTLERALSKELQARRSVSRGPPTGLELMRSATATASFKRDGSVPVLKREASESTLLGLTSKTTEAAPPALVAAKGMHIFARSKSFTSLDEAKAKRKAATEAELRDAISGIRKPNRERAGNSLADDAKKRVGLDKNVSKKASRSSQAPSVLVQATPVNNRFKNVLGNSQTQNSVFEPEDYEMLIPPSSVSCVPDTAPRSGFRDAIPATPCVAATPMGRRKSLPARSLLQPIPDNVPPSSPFMARGGYESDHDELEIPDTIKRDGRQPLTHVANRSIFETPSKGRSKVITSNLFSGLKPSTSEGGGGGTKGKTIYEKLGWDDDDLDELV